jgi:two-component system, chemotaxis family, response regulator Rcp1
VKIRTPAAGKVRVLLVEDNPADVRLVQETLKDSSLAIHLDVTRDGVDAVHWLSECTPSHLPHLILLDLNLPRKSGFDVLKEIKGNPKLRSIPIVILTTSDAEKDIARCYDLHANAFITKPVDLEGFIDTMRKTEDFWFTIARYPIRNPHGKQDSQNPAC